MPSSSERETAPFHFARLAGVAVSTGTSSAAQATASADGRSAAYSYPPQQRSKRLLSGRPELPECNVPLGKCAVLKKDLHYVVACPPTTLSKAGRFLLFRTVRRGGGPPQLFFFSAQLPPLLHPSDTFARSRVLASWRVLFPYTTSLSLRTKVLMPKNLESLFLSGRAFATRTATGGRPQKRGRPAPHFSRGSAPPVAGVGRAEEK